MKFTIEMNIHELSRSIKAGTLETLVTDIMSHENQVRSEQTAAVKDNSVPTKAVIDKPTPEATAKESTPAPEPIPAPEEKKTEINEVQIRAKFVELSKKGKKKELKTLLGQLGVEKVSDIKPEQYQEAWAGLEALENE